MFTYDVNIYVATDLSTAELIARSSSTNESFDIDELVD